MSHTPRLAALPTWQLSQAAARAHRVLHDHLARAEASGYDYRVLSALGDSGQASQADLGRAVALDRRDVTDTVRGLEVRQLVSRRPNPRDARELLVELTAAGRTALERLDTVVEDAQSEALAPLGASQRQALLRLLARLAK